MMHKSQTITIQAFAPHRVPYMYWQTARGRGDKRGDTHASTIAMVNRKMLLKSAMIVIKECNEPVMRQRQ